MMAQLSRRAFLASVPLVVPRVTGGLRIVDLGTGCILPESLAGYRGAVARLGHVGARAWIVPGAATETWHRDGPVLLESALGLVEPRRDYGSYSPYVDFQWPVRAKIREFFPKVLKPRPGDAVIATYGNLPVGVRRGELILLASPVGPSLLAGDPDAHRWLAAVLLWMGRGFEEQRSAKFDRQARGWPAHFA